MKVKLILATILFLSGFNSWSLQCRDLFPVEKKIYTSDQVLQQLKDNYDSPNIKALKEFNKILEQYPELKVGETNRATRFFFRLMHNELDSVLHLTAEKLFVNVNSNLLKLQLVNANRLSKDEVKGVFVTELNNLLKGLMSETWAYTRSRSLFSSDLDYNGFLKSLGHMTAKDSLENLVGAGGIENVSEDSLVGRYLKSARDSGHEVQTLVSNFDQGPASKLKGSKRLFIGYDERTSPLVNNSFKEHVNYLVHRHTESQGTLYLNFLGRYVSYASFSTPLTNLTGFNVRLPLIVLSTEEASRAFNYFELGFMTGRARSKYPSSFAQIKSDSTVDKYLPDPGYGCCSHWFGEMPIGDIKNSNQQSFPGKFDDYGRDDIGIKQNRQRLIRDGYIKPYTHFIRGNAPQKVDNQVRLDRLTRLVWRENLANQQMWELLGVPKNSLRSAELTNPGYIFYNLAAKANPDRVPVIFFHREDASLPISAQEIANMKRHISYY